MQNAQPCFYCYAPATHFCTMCGHMICDSPICAASAAASVGRQAISAVSTTATAAVKTIGAFAGVKGLLRW